jgi:hypothetical protein
MSDVERAIQALLDPPLAPPPDLARLEQRARVIRRRSRAKAIATFVAATLVVVGVAGAFRQHQLQVAAGNWRSYEHDGLRFRLPPGWHVVGDLTLQGVSASPRGVPSQGRTLAIKPGVVIASRRLAKHVDATTLSEDDFKRFPNDLVLIEIGDNVAGPELGPPDGGLGNERARPRGVRGRFGQLVGSIDIAAYAGVNAPADKWALVDEIVATIEAPDGVPPADELDVFDKAAANATRVALHDVERSPNDDTDVSVMVGDRCMRLTGAPLQGQDAGRAGSFFSQCVRAWTTPGAGTMEFIVNQPLQELTSAVVMRVGPGIAKVVGTAQDGTTWVGSISPDGWALVLSQRDENNNGNRMLARVTALDTKGRKLTELTIPGSR